VQHQAVFVARHVCRPWTSGCPVHIELLRQFG